MLDDIETFFVNWLTIMNINAMKKYSHVRLDKHTASVCVGINKAELSPAGLGGYIGIGESDGTVKEFYGQHAKLDICLEIFTPADENSSRCEEMLDELTSILYPADIVISSYTVNAPVYDSKSEMFRCDVSAQVNVLLVREMRDGELSDYELGGDAL